MSADDHDVALRVARNRVIDLLGIGDTYPVTDLNLVADRRKVPYAGATEISIEHAQWGVAYLLCESRQELGETLPLDSDAPVGKDATLAIETPPIRADDAVTYRIRAIKQPSEWTTLEALWLDQRVEIAVGVDTGLEVEIINAPPLDPEIAEPPPSALCILAYEDAEKLADGAKVLVKKAQEGVTYTLVLDDIEIGDPVAGRGGNIELPVGPVREDTVIQVRASKTSLDASDPDRQEAHLLDAKLYLKVRASPSAAVTIVPSSIVDYGGDTSINIASTQESVTYRAYVHPLRDDEFVHRDPNGKKTASVSDKADVQVSWPAYAPASDLWFAPDGYTSIGGDAVQGTGGDLRIPLPDARDDTVVIVQAIKHHVVHPDDPSAEVIASEVRLEQPAVVLVRPDLEKALSLRIPMGEGKTVGSLRVAGGQPGVFYHFSLAPARPGGPRCVYFHQRDPRDESQNKGLRERNGDELGLGIEIDFAVTADSDKGPSPNPATESPPDPVLDIAPVDAGETGIRVRAVKARTGVDATMRREASIHAVPAIRAEPAAVAHGERATIRIFESDPLDTYQLVLDGDPVSEPMPGDGTDLTLLSSPLTTPTIIEVVVTRSRAAELRVERVVRVPVSIGPG